MNPILLCPLLAAAVSGQQPMRSVPSGYVAGICHYEGTSPRGYTLVTAGDARADIAARYGDAADITAGDETVITWSDLDRPRDLARDGIRMIVLVRQGATSRVHVSALDRPSGAPR